ncbi:intracellular ribonuclease LX precursor, putative [Entamoeba invadens IP1]|uniref:Intracellular ribonuclease LX, putative n=1 Tax=Entamoeba invadens IP1 TaxID=370355 RepID=L7FPE5_ENTIV|nr:intracellular ribonuclease LX precursor, putative [Entamoeba invadens IP1]ELP90976.1 intracellular ribonuclease LX precursor, putative [Entamoeba invadens IP1]|eukprot:XP_004257747.1 intracellular ribonuclease LX precursor, putative [Entamoeba invadens IP1]
MLFFLLILIPYALCQPDSSPHSSGSEYPSTSQQTSEGAKAKSKGRKQREQWKKTNEEKTSSEEGATSKLKHPIAYPTETTPFGKTIIILKYYDMCNYYRSYVRLSDYYLFVLFWPIKCYDIVCSLPQTTMKLEEEFMFHGFWPQFDSNKHMQCCKNNFMIENVEAMMKSDEVIKEFVLSDWMSLEKCVFSTFQMDKHGSCSYDIYKGPNGPKQYIETMMFLKSQFKVWSFLKESELKVETNKMYEKETLRKVLRNRYGANPTFNCIDNTNIMEIRFCFDPKRNKMHPPLIECSQRIYAYEKRKCGDKVMFLDFPKYLLDLENVQRNNCVM